MGDMADRAMRQELERELAALREENARLRELGSVKSALKLQDERQELVKTKLALTSERDEAEEYVAALRERIEELEDFRVKELEAQRVKVLAMGERDDALAEIDKVLADAIYQREEKEKAEAEVGRLRAITSPGDAAAFEEHMAAREAHWVTEVARLEGLILDWHEATEDGKWEKLVAEAERIRAQREKGKL